MAEYADKLYARRCGNTVTAVNANHDSAINAVSGGRRRESSPHDRRRRSPSRRPARGAAAGRPPGRTKTTATSATTTPPTANRQGSASLAASGSRETDQPLGTERSRRWHDRMTTASNSSWWTLAQCAVSFPIVPMRSQPAHSSLAPTADQSQRGVPSAAAFRSGCARFLLPSFSPPASAP